MRCAEGSLLSALLFDAFANTDAASAGVGDGASATAPGGGNPSAVATCSFGLDNPGTGPTSQRSNQGGFLRRIYLEIKAW